MSARGGTPLSHVGQQHRVPVGDEPAGGDLANLLRVDRRLGIELEAAQRGWSVIGEYVDEGISGAAESRPALDRLLADARAGKLDLVVVWRLDRLGRSLVHLLEVLDGFTAQGVGFLSLRDAGIDTTTPTGRLLLQLLGAFAEFERWLIRERVIAGVRRAQAAGKHCGRPRVEVDLRPAVALLREGRSLREAAEIVRLDRNTLRRRLREEGMWPLPGPGEGAVGDARA